MENSKQSIGQIIQEAMGKVREMVDVNTIVGQPISTPDGVTLIPISRVSFGFGGAGGDFAGKNTALSNCGAGIGVGVKVAPVAFLIIKEGAVRVLPVAVPAATTVDRVVEMVPDLVDKIAALFPDKESKKEPF